MKQNELRIGNWVDWDEKTIRSEVKGIHPSGNYLHLENGWVQLSRCEPIPLTEECLVRFGFKKVQSLREDHCNYSIDIIKRNYKSHYFPNLVWYQKKGFTLKNIYIGYDLKYVHQLQNLYFALTGEELELK